MWFGVSKYNRNLQHMWFIELLNTEPHTLANIAMLINTHTAEDSRVSQLCLQPVIAEKKKPS